MLKCSLLCYLWIWLVPVSVTGLEISWALLGKNLTGWAARLLWLIVCVLRCINICSRCYMVDKRSGEVPKCNAIVMKLSGWHQACPLNASSSWEGAGTEDCWKVGSEFASRLLFQPRWREVSADSGRARSSWICSVCSIDAEAAQLQPAFHQLLQEQTVYHQTSRTSGHFASARRGV